MLSEQPIVAAAQSVHDTIASFRLIAGQLADESFRPRAGIDIDDDERVSIHTLHDADGLHWPIALDIREAKLPAAGSKVRPQNGMPESDSSQVSAAAEIGICTLPSAMTAATR